MAPRRSDGERPDWVPGLGLLAAALGSGAVAGYTFAAGRPPLYLLAVLVVVYAGLTVAAWRRLRSRRAPLPADGERHTTRTARRAPDLARDRSTDAQKYLM